MGRHNEDRGGSRPALLARLTCWPLLIAVAIVLLESHRDWGSAAQSRVVANKDTVTIADGGCSTASSSSAGLHAARVAVRLSTTK